VESVKGGSISNAKFGQKKRVELNGFAKIAFDVGQMMSDFV
jgi:hypothetical protein